MGDERRVRTDARASPWVPGPFRVSACPRAFGTNTFTSAIDSAARGYIGGEETVNPLDLIGKRVLYEGREGHVRSVHAGKDRPPALRIALRVPHNEPHRVIDVPESEWTKLQFLSS